MPVEYFHVVFTVPEEIAAIAFYNTEVVYGILFRAAAENASDHRARPKHLGAEIGFFAVLQTWGQNLLDHPHLHWVVPGGGLTPDHTGWVACRPGFFLPVRMLSRLFRFSKRQTPVLRRTGATARSARLRPFYTARAGTEWVVYTKPPFGGPPQVREYLGRYTHRVALSNQRLLSMENGSVTFHWKDYRQPEKPKVMTLAADEFIRRFLVHVLPPGFKRIRHFGFLASRHRREKLTLCR